MNVKNFSIYGSTYLFGLTEIKNKIGNLDIFLNLDRNRNFDFFVCHTDFDNQILEINKQ
jgi:hypothetical protein